MDDIKTIKNLPFSGKKSDFKLWKFKFLAICGFQKCQQILIDKTAIAPKFDKVLDPTKDRDVLLENYRNQNTKAYMFLTICITDAITFEAVQNAVTDNLPTGDAKLAWKNICNINQPVTASEQHDLEQQFYQCTLADEHTNPDKWFVKLENIRITLKK